VVLDRSVDDGVPSDDVMVRRVIAGDHDAMAWIYERYVGDVFAVARSVHREPEQAEEVVQETFLALWNRAELFDPDRGSLGGWLAAIARNRAIDRHRAAARRSRGSAFSSVASGGSDGAAVGEWLVATGDPIGVGVADPPPDVIVSRREDVSELRSALARLPDSEREVILLAYRDGLSQSEIALRLGWPLGTVKTRSRRALRHLRDVLDGGPESSMEGAERPPASRGEASVGRSGTSPSRHRPTPAAGPVAAMLGGVGPSVAGDRRSTCCQPT
jgi:RNA polymerase sigma-70 factor (ECF subfamily)